jgi:hypothetical protein
MQDIADDVDCCDFFSVLVEGGDVIAYYFPVFEVFGVEG